MTAATVPRTDEGPSDTVPTIKVNDGALPEITSLLASFVAETTFDRIPDDVKRWLKMLLLDYVGVSSFAATRADSSDPFFNATKTLYPEVLTQTQEPNGINGSVGHHPSTPSTIIGRRSKGPSRAAALLNGAFAHSLDFDDTHMTGIVHIGATVISAALAEGEQSSVDGAKFLTALAVGYEVVCRIGFGLRTGGFERGFHNTSTAGIFGAIAAIAKLRDLDSCMVESAFGIGESKAAGSMQYLQNGAWNKRLHPGFAAHDAFICVALAQAGVVGAAKAIEGNHGFLHSYTTGKSCHDFESVVEGLGSQWTLKGTAVKPYPACRCAHPGIDLAAKMRLSPRNQKYSYLPNGTTTYRSHKHIKTNTAPHIEFIRLNLSPSFYNLVGDPTPNKVHPQNIVDAQFSGYYQVAVAWLYGAQNGWTVYDHLWNPRVHSLTDRISVIRDPSFLSPLNARLTIQYTDGSEESEFLEAPLGEPSNPIPDETIYRKFRSLVEPVWGKLTARQIEDAVEKIDTSSVRALMELLF